MGHDVFEITVNLLKLVVLFLLIVQAVPVLVWLERRGSAFIQNRLGPNRIGPFGLMQLLADAVKFLWKEEFIPDAGNRILYYGAPIMALIPATLAFCALPLGHPISIAPFEMLGQTWGPYTFLIQGYNVSVGIVFVLAASSLGTYAILMAGFGSGNKYSLMGALRQALKLSLTNLLWVFRSSVFCSFTELLILPTWLQPNRVHCIFDGARRSTQFRFCRTGDFFSNPLLPFYFLQRRLQSQIDCHLICRGRSGIGRRVSHRIRRI